MSRRKPKPRVLHLQGAHSEHCPWCTRQWWRWLADMMARTWGGGAFYEHAATSNRGPGPGEEHADVYPVYVGQAQTYSAEPDIEFLAPAAIDAELLRRADELRERLAGAFGIPAELLGVVDAAARRFDERPISRASIAAQRELRDKGDK